jgi:hypothetical protein
VGIYPCPQHRQTYSASAARARLWSGLIFFGDGSAGYAAYLWASIRSISGLRASFAETQYPCGFWPFGGSIGRAGKRMGSLALDFGLDRPSVRCGALSLQSLLRSRTRRR